MNRKCYSFDAATDAVESELLEDPLRRELHDSWITCREDASEILIGQSHARVSRIHVVRKIEGRELSYCLMEDRLKYVERDRSKIRNTRLAWFWTVPVDLMTCPFQAFVYVVFMISGAPIRS